MSGDIPDEHILLTPEEFNKRCEQATALIKKLGEEYPYEKLVALLHDQEYNINLLQLFLNVWVIATKNDDDPTTRLSVMRTVTQAAFILGYQYRMEIESVDNKLPDSVSTFMKDLPYENRET